MRQDKMITELKRKLGDFSEAELYDLLAEKSKISYLKINSRELEIFRLRLIEKLKYREIAEHIGISIATINSIIDKVLYEKLYRLKDIENGRGISIFIRYKCERRILNLILRYTNATKNSSLEEFIKYANRILDYKKYARGLGIKSEEKLRNVIHNICKDFNLDPEMRFPEPIEYTTTIDEVCERINVSVKLELLFLHYKNLKIKESTVDKILELYYLCMSKTISIDIETKDEFKTFMDKLISESHYRINIKSRLLELGVVRECIVSPSIICYNFCDINCETYKNRNIFKTQIIR